MSTLKSKRFPLPRQVIETWAAMTDDFHVITMRYLDSRKTLPPWFLHDIPAADRAMSAALSKMRESHPDTDFQATFCVVDGEPMVEVTWASR